MVDVILDSINHCEKKFAFDKVLLPAANFLRSGKKNTLQELFMHIQMKSTWFASVRVTASKSLLQFVRGKQRWFLKNQKENLFMAAFQGCSACI